jgi:hypothetical protein
MRHLGTLIAALVMAPLAWLLVAFGQDRSAQAFAHAQSAGAFDTADFIRPVLVLGAAGLLLGLIATLRFSPLGAVVAGIGYAGCYTLLLVAPDGVLRLFRHHLSIAGRRADLSTPLRTGTALLIGALLVVGVASVGRWRRWPHPATPRLDTDRSAAPDAEDAQPAARPTAEPDRLPEDRDEPDSLASHGAATQQATQNGTTASSWVESPHDPMADGIPVGHRPNIQARVEGSMRGVRREVTTHSDPRQL